MYIYIEKTSEYKLVTEAQIEGTSFGKAHIRFYHLTVWDNEIKRHSHVSEEFDSVLKALAVLRNYISNSLIYEIKEEL